MKTTREQFINFVLMQLPDKGGVFINADQILLLKMGAIELVRQSKAAAKSTPARTKARAQNGKGGGRPPIPESDLTPAQLKRRQRYEKAKSLRG